MTWTRLTDNWTDSPVLRPLSLAARWHYLALIQWCCRNEDYTGLIRLRDADRASDVDDVAQATGELIAAGLVENVDGATLRVMRLDDHALPKSMRDPQRRERQRIEKRRSREHAKGNHVECLPDRCDHAGSPVLPVTASPVPTLPDPASVLTSAETGISDDDEAMWAEIVEEENRKAS